MACIMLVEDDFALRALMTQVLKLAGHEIVPAQDGPSALDKLGPDQDLIILDLGLPNMDGSTFLAEALSRGYAGKVMVVSGSDTGREVARMMSSDGYLAKPFDPQQLEDEVERTLRR
jgi:two-component system OmpR family response regulator